MSRFSRINTIWRKELLDTLRDRRTVIAMVLVPLVLYPALMLGSLQAFEAQTTQLKAESYDIAVADAATRDWLRRAIDTDPVRRFETTGMSAEQIAALHGDDDESPGSTTRYEDVAASETDPGLDPPAYRLFVEPDVRGAVMAGRQHVGVVREAGPSEGGGPAGRMTLVLDRTEYRSRFAATHLRRILMRYQDRQLLELNPTFRPPFTLTELSVASPEKVGGSILGQIVPLILIVMTITGAIYPAIDLTAGERERGTLETLMVAPVPKVDLIAGKFIVVMIIGMMSALLNLVSIGGTIYFGGLGEILTGGDETVVFPLTSLPWVLILLIPLAVMFSAILLAVCSFARSFKEAQNYVMPVMVAALIPAVVGALPGTRLEGLILIMPVANIVVLTRDLFMGHVDLEAIFWVTLSTCVYAGAAVAVAAKLFGQEAVLFADSVSLKTLFRRRFFKRQAVPTIAQALLVMAIIYPANFFLQTAIGQTEALSQNIGYLAAVALVFITLFVLVPMVAAKYTRVSIPSAFALTPPSGRAIAAGLCFGLSTWILARAWLEFQSEYLMPMSPELKAAFEAQFGWLETMPLWMLVFFMAIVPAVCEELFFRGYVLGGTRINLGKLGAVLLVSVAFGVFHQSVYRLPTTIALGALFGLLAIQARSIWPCMLAHAMHNGLTLAGDAGALGELLRGLGYDVAAGAPPTAWVVGAAGLTLLGVVLCLMMRSPAPRVSAAFAVEPEPTRT